jgi:ABC-type spermidine/putrescine transport system permease subunit II
MGLAAERRDARPFNLSGALPASLRDPVTDPASLLASPVAAFAVPSSDAERRGAAPTSGRSGHSLDLESITHSFGTVKVALFMSPLILPALAFGLAALMFFTMLGFRLSLATMILGHVAVITPFILRTTIASLSQLDLAQLDTSASLGAGPLYTFRRVTLPVIRPGILAGAFLAFMASVDNVSVSLFLANPETDVLPIRMWSMLESTLDVRTAAVSGVLIATTALFVFVMDRVAGLTRRLT